MRSSMSRRSASDRSRGTAQRSVAGVLVAFERGFDAGDCVVFRRERRSAGTLPPIADLPQSRKDVRLELIELFLTHLTKLDTHLRRQQLVAQCSIVVQLGIHRRGNLVEHESQAANQQGIEYEHCGVPIEDCRFCDCRLPIETYD